MTLILLQRVSASIFSAGLTLCLTASCVFAGEAGPAGPVSGTASWFGAWHHGKNTASGEPFDMYAMTAAHRKLPFGTVIRVTNTRNGKDVVVRINDRGPYRKKRILDLSYAAADRLGMRASGTAPITLEVVGDTGGRPLEDGQAFFVRLAEQAPASASLLEQQMGRLVRVGFQEAPTLLCTTDNAVALGPFDSFQAAQETLVRVSTLYPFASIMLIDRGKTRPVVLPPDAAASGT
ncbi:MAG: septal ring lytic transglycosylase RlpA family protein [Desulfovibrionaceae bacterium]|nr:septal ring lytic transglycosylase RlpA family protein [Desulfovibrionaceae bacterium]